MPSYTFQLPIRYFGRAKHFRTEALHSLVLSAMILIGHFYQGYGEAS